MLARLLGIALIGYAAGYRVAALSDGRAFMRLSVDLRGSILPAIAILVAIGWLPLPLLALGVIDAAGALWTRHELRQSDHNPTTAARPAARKLT